MCDSELFPVSMFKEVDKNQPSNLPESDDIERPKGRSVYERYVHVHCITTNDGIIGHYYHYHHPIV